MASDPYLGEIRMYGGNTPPPGWNLCDGTSLSISNNVALYGLIGDTFGGNSQFFNLPDLRGRFFVSTDGNQYSMGQTGGAEQVSLLDINLPSHTHSVNCSATGGLDTPKGNTWGLATNTVYSPPASGVLARAMSTLCIQNAGLGKPHENMIPFQVVNYMIALVGIFPSSAGEGGAVAEGAVAAGEGGGTAGAVAAGQGDAAGAPGAVAAGQGDAAGAPGAAAGTVDQYMSEIRIFPFAFVPRGWLACNGQQLPVGPNQALYSLLMNTYGGTTSFFNLPNLVGRVVTHAGMAHTLGQSGGEAGHVLLTGEMPAHNHIAQASSSGPAVGLPNEAFWATNTGVKPYGGPAVPLMAPSALNTAGGNIPHENRSPYVVLNICICIVGIYPSKN